MGSGSLPARRAGWPLSRGSRLDEGGNAVSSGPLTIGFGRVPLNYRVDFLIISIFLLVQGRITVMLLRAAAQRFCGDQLALARFGIAALDVFVIAGYALSFSSVLSR